MSREKPRNELAGLALAILRENQVNFITRLRLDRIIENPPKHKPTVLWAADVIRGWLDEDKK